MTNLISMECAYSLYKASTQKSPANLNYSDFSLLIRKQNNLFKIGSFKVFVK